MREGRMRGGIFAVCTPSPGATWEAVPRDDGVMEYPPMSLVSQPDAAAHATAAAGRLLALERAGLVRLARGVADLDEALGSEDGPPVTVLHLEGAEAIDPRLEALD